MKRQFKDCPKCGQKDGLETITVRMDMFIQIRILKCDTCPYQPEYDLKKV